MGKWFRRGLAALLVMMSTAACVRADPASVGVLSDGPIMRERPTGLRPKTIAVSPSSRLVFRTVYPKREGPLRGDLQLIEDGERVIWFKDLSRYVTPDFGPGVWMGDLVAMPSAPVIDDATPVETSMSLVRMQNGRRPKLIAYWRITPPNITETIGAIQIESRRAVSFTVFRAPEAGRTTRYRCTLGQLACATT